MRDFLKTVVWGMLALLLGVLVYAVFALVSIAAEVNRTLEEFQLTAIDARAAITAVAIQANWTQQDALKIVDATSKDIRYQTKVALDRADKRIGEAIERSDARIGEAIGTLDEAVAVSAEQLGRVNDTVASVVEPVRGVAEKVDSTMPLYTDCDSGTCLFNLIYGTAKSTQNTMRSVETMSEVIAAKAPSLAESADSIGKSADSVGKDVAKITGEYTSTKRRILELLMGAWRLFF